MMLWRSKMICLAASDHYGVYAKIEGMEKG